MSLQLPSRAHTAPEPPRHFGESHREGLGCGMCTGHPPIEGTWGAQINQRKHPSTGKELDFPWEGAARDVPGGAGGAEVGRGAGRSR